jgi:hypothetical protein
MGGRLNSKVVKVKRRAKHQRNVGVRPQHSDITLERTKALLLAALKVWELKQRVL